MAENDKFRALLERADRASIDGDESAKLSDKELELVAAELEKPDTSADRFFLIRILGVSLATTYQPLVERFLISENDPMLAYAALGMLCNYWALEKQYLREILEFIQGVPWDTNEEVRTLAISIAGEYLRETENRDFLATILAIFEDDREDHLLRESAYLSLARAVGRNYNETPSAAYSFDLVDDIDPSVIEQVKQRLSSGSQ